MFNKNFKNYPFELEKYIERMTENQYIDELKYTLKTKQIITSN